MPNLTEAPAPPDSSRPRRFRRDKLAAVGILAPVAGIPLIIAASSYYHEYRFASRNGQPQWAAALLPFTIDGLVLAAGIAVLWGMANGIRHPWRPLLAIAVGGLATLAANVFSDLTYWWLSPAVSGWAGVAVFCVADVGIWWLNEYRKRTDPDVIPEGGDCSCPRPATDLPGALRAARGELKASGRKYGEDVLAELFSTEFHTMTRHQARLLLTVPQPPAGTAAFPPEVTVPAGLNGSGSHD